MTVIPLSVCVVVVAISHCCVQLASAIHQRYDDYSAVDIDSATGSFVPTQNDCVAMSDAQQSAIGAVYSITLHICKVMTNDNNQIGMNLHQNVGWVTFVKDISNVQVVLAKFQNRIVT
jgi:hypothetical protein